jgi:hypothetical protein
MLDPALITATAPSAGEVGFAESVLARVATRFGAPLYARVDLIAGDDGEPLLLELEAVEPNLYLAHSPGSPERFAQAVRDS